MMTQAFVANKDLHSFSACLMYDEDYDTFTKKVESGDPAAKEKRTVAKTVSFGALYGSGPPNLARVLNVDFEKAAEIIDRFWSAYPSLKNAMTRYGDLANQYGYSNTVIGRRRYYTDALQKIKWIELDNNIHSIQKRLEDMKMLWFFEKNGPVTFDNINLAKKLLIKRLRGEISRQAGNHPIQGTAADMMKLAAILIRKDFIRKDIDAKIVGLIHDEIIVECIESSCEEVYKLIELRMKQALNRFCPNVPAAVEGKICKVWKK